MNESRVANVGVEEIQIFEVRQARDRLQPGVGDRVGFQVELAE